MFVKEFEIVSQCVSITVSRLGFRAQECEMLTRLFWYVHIIFILLKNCILKNQNTRDYRTDNIKQLTFHCSAQ